MIVIEGPDGSGKTTLARYVRDELGYEVHHEGPPKTPDVLQLYAGLMFKAMHTRRGGVVFDRLHLGENVYGPLLRGRSLIDGEYGLTLLHRCLSAWQACVIICLPPYEVCLENWRARHKLELIEDEAQFKASYDAYAEYAKRLIPHPTVDYRLYDYTRHVPSQTVRFRKPCSVTHANWIGSRRAKYMIVGEVANHPWLDLPFMSLKGSSRYLNEALWDAGYTEEELAFVNAISLDGKKANAVLLRSSGEYGGLERTCKFITLGGVAADLFPKSEKRAYHPAYWKRFHANERQRYVDHLREFREQSHGTTSK